MRADCRVDGALATAVFGSSGATLALEGCSLSGQATRVPTLFAAVRLFSAALDSASGSSIARLQNCTFSGNDVDVGVFSSGDEGAESVLYTDTPVANLTVIGELDVNRVELLAEAPAGFPNMTSPAFVALREVRPGQTKAREGMRRGPLRGRVRCLLVDRVHRIVFDRALAVAPMGVFRVPFS